MLVHGGLKLACHVVQDVADTLAVETFHLELLHQLFAVGLRCFDLKLWDELFRSLPLPDLDSLDVRFVVLALGEHLLFLPRPRPVDCT